ncbi:MAG TPA: hypothetical protein VFO55_08455 [Gemmatimonadaceae bacterium]|nr:hypothetical protein [Gemmatimonadaceae bacterium]
MPRRSPAWVSRSLLVTGLLAVFVGTMDPLEGSVAILAGFVLVTIAAGLRHSRRRNGLAWSVSLVAVGVATMFVLSAYGGVGGRTGRSMWWALTILPYPIGWIIGVVESVRLVREPSAP